MADATSEAMRAARIHATGGSGQMRIESVLTPRADGEHILVRVEVAGINVIERGCANGGSTW